MRKNIATYYLSALVFSLLLLASCREKAKPEIVDLDALRPKPERQYEIDPDTITLPVFTLEDVKLKLKPFVAEIFMDSLFTPVDVEIYPYRFGAKEYLALEQQDPNKNVLGTWYFLEFGDSVRTDNAFLNWLDCFGGACQSLEISSTETIIETTGQIWVTNEILIAFFSKPGYSITPKEILKMSRFLEDDLRYGLKWNKNKSAEWEGNLIHP
jgi:hypothetical protein